jgi:hypothetical protein
VSSEVGSGEKTAMFLNKVSDLLCDFAFIENVRPTRGDAIESIGEVCVTKDIAGPGRFAVDQKRVSKTRLIAKNCLTALPRCGDNFSDGEALASVFNGRLHQSFEGKFSKTDVKLEPAINAARNGDGQDAEGGDAFELSFFEFIESEAGRRSAARIETMETLGFTIPNNCEKVSTDTAAGGFGECQHGVRGDRCINSRATFPEDIKGGDGGERLAGGSHAVSGDDFRASGKGLAGRSIAGKQWSGKHKQNKGAQG